VCKTPHVLKPSEPLPAEASKKSDNSLREKLETNNDDMKQSATDTSTKKSHVTNAEVATLLDLCRTAFESKTHESQSQIDQWILRHENDHSLLSQELNKKDERNYTPAHYIAGLKPTWDLMKKIIDICPDTLKAIDNTGRTPLHWASRWEASAEVVNLYLDKYPSCLDVKDDFGMSPLDHASDNSCLRNLLREPDFPDPSKSSTIEQDKVFINNKTGRRLKISYRETEDQNSIRQDGTIDPGTEMVFHVKGSKSSAKGLIFDFLLCDNETYGWKLNVFVKKGYCQIIRGQPRLMNQHNTKDGILESKITSEKTKQQQLERSLQSKHETSQDSWELYNLCVQAYENKTKESYDKIHEWLLTHEKKFLMDSLDQRDEEHRTPTHYLLGAKPPLPLVQEFVKLSHGILMKQDKAFRVPLHWAAKCCASQEVVNFLIDKDPKSLDAVDYFGMSPLHHAPKQSNLTHLLRGPHLPDPKANKNENDKNVIYIANSTGRILKVEYRKALRSTAKVGFHAAGYAVIFEPTPRPESNSPCKKTIDPNATCKFPVEKCRGLKFDFWCESKEQEGYGWQTNVFVKKGYTQEIRGQPRFLGIK